MKKPNVWKILGAVALILGAVLVLLAAGRADGDLGSIFRQCWTGLFFCAIGAAAVYADVTAEEDEAYDDKG